MDLFCTEILLNLIASKIILKSLVNKGVIIIPNSSKTEKEIEKFNEELGVNLPFISENGSSIHGLNLITSNFPDKLILR